VVRQEIHHQEVVVRRVHRVQAVHRVQDQDLLKGRIHQVQVLPVVLHQVRVHQVLPVVPVVLPVVLHQVHPVKLIQKEKVKEKVIEGQETTTEATEATAVMVIIIEEAQIQE
jgi:hypothetical protein